MKLYSFLSLLCLLNNIHAAEKQKADIQVGMSDVPPISYMEDGVLKGYNIDILKQLESKSNLKFNYTLYPHARITKLLSDENPDLIITFTVICKRYPQYEFQKKLYSLKPSILLKKNIDPKKQDIRIGKVIGTCNELAEKNAKHDSIVDVTSMDQTFKMLKANRLDGICGNEAVLNYNLNNNKEFINQLVRYKTQGETTDFDAVICRKKNLPLTIKKKLDEAAAKIVIPRLKNFI